MQTLPLLPAHVQLLTDADNERLEREFPDLPVSSADCMTCHGRKTFLSYPPGVSYAPGLELEIGIEEYECNCYDQFVLQRYLLNAGVGRWLAQQRWADAAIGRRGRAEGDQTTRPTSAVCRPRHTGVAGSHECKSGHCC
jgi:hypothetical protein